MCGMSDLGAALRAWRDRMDPTNIGLANGSARRVAGLRRGELAALAAISPEYVARLEQGRATTPSPQVCASLARALRLSSDEEAHLMRLAGYTASPARIPRAVPDSLYRVIDQLANNPVAVYDALWRLLHWNHLFAALFGDPTDAADEDRNAMIVQFESRNPRVRHTVAERAYFEQALVADLRATSASYPTDPDIAALVERLSTHHRFRELWALGTVATHESAHKTAEHPVVGTIPLDANILTTQSTDLRVVILTPRPDTDARIKLEMLSSEAPPSD